jgi:two-component system, chemotaxis family, chemotaxis protein CheY
MRVLIVDDSKAARMQCKSALPTACTTDVFEASNGAQAIEICRTKVIELMMLGLTMPESDRAELA